MTKFRKKPVVIEAVQWIGKQSLNDVAAFLDNADVVFHNPYDENGYITIPTLEGVMQVSMGDWIIRGVKGELYPCKPDIFAATYESAEEQWGLLYREMSKGATISDDKQFRYSLHRTWEPTLQRLIFVMLNPSTADSMKDDPTIKKLIKFARGWGFGGIIVRNLFAFRATDPKELLTAADPVGPKNDMFLKTIYPRCVVAWGTNGTLLNRDKTVLKMLRKKGVELLCMGKSKDGHPLHPLFLKGDTQLVPYNGE